MRAQPRFHEHVKGEFDIRVRVWVAVLGMLLAQSYVFFRLLDLQVYKQSHYATLSTENRVKVLPIAPSRGLIYTRDGVLIAENRPAFNLVVVPEEVGTRKALDAVLAEVCAALNLPPDTLVRFHEARRGKRRFDRITLKLNLTEAEVARLSIDRHRYPGVHVEASPTRFYPQGPLYAHVLGYVGRIDENELKTLDSSNYAATTHVGKSGIEKAYEAELHGRVGYQHVEVNAQGRLLRVLERNAAYPGNDLYLSIDSTLQQAAWDALGEHRGAVVAIEPATGRVLALVSKPAYEPNAFVNGISGPDYRALLDSPDRPLYNRAIQAQYPPGSTVKPMVAFAGLYAGVRQSDTPTWCPGWYRLPSHSHQYRDWKKGGHGTVNLHDAIAESCDVYFYDLARDLGIDRLHDLLTRFSLGERTGIDLPGESAGLWPSRAWKQSRHKAPWYPGETLIAGIGQGYVLATPLQLAEATATLVRKGVRRAPRIVGQMEDPVGQVATEIYGAEVARYVDAKPEHWQVIFDAMHAVVQAPNGTARKTGLDAPYAYAGKTGTAQVIGIAQGAKYDEKRVAERHKDHGLFVAFAPLENPVIALSVVVENGGSGSGAAAPIARRLFDHYLGVAAAAASAPISPEAVIDPAPGAE